MCSVCVVMLMVRVLLGCCISVCMLVLFSMIGSSLFFSVLLWKMLVILLLMMVCRFRLVSVYGVCLCEEL